MTLTTACDPVKVIDQTEDDETASASDDGDTDGDIDGDGDTDGDGDGTDGDDPLTEADCEDGADDDGDGAIDCEDEDCAEVFKCTWPDVIEHQTQVNFDGNEEVVCVVIDGIWEEEFSVDDCETILDAQLTWTEDGSLCPSCDRTYEGLLEVRSDSCESLTGEPVKDVEGRFGFTFITENERELWALDELTNEWTYVINLLGSEDGEWSFTEGVAFSEDFSKCTNSPLELGYFSVTLEFSDRR